MAKKPRDLGNDQMFIRTTTNGTLTNAGFRVEVSLKHKAGRAAVRRFAQRLLDMCDWWENQ
jgi:hypothetical protein